MTKSETTLSELLDVIAEHTLALKAHTGALDRAAGGAGKDADRRESRAEPEKTERAAPEREERRSPGRPRKSENDAKIPKGDIPSESERRDRMRKFLEAVDDLFDGDKDRDAEYDRRIAEVFDPIFKKAKVSEPKDIPAEFWPEIASGIEAYEKDFDEAASKRATGRRRRDV